MTPKQIAKIKAEYFRVQSLRTGIPIEFFELPPAVIAAYEDGEREAAAREREQKWRREHGKEKPPRVWEYPGALCPRLVRRPVGDFSLPDFDNFPDW